MSLLEEVYRIHVCVPSTKLTRENTVRDPQILTDLSLCLLLDNFCFLLQNSVQALPLLGSVSSVLDGICLVSHYYYELQRPVFVTEHLAKWLACGRHSLNVS